MTFLTLAQDAFEVNLWCTVYATLVSWFTQARHAGVTGVSLEDAMEFKQKAAVRMASG